MQLTEANGVQLYFDNLVFNYGDVAGDAVVEYEFPFKGEADQIEYVEKGCGCTSAYYEDGKVKGQLELAKTAPPNGYGDGSTPVMKYVFVYLNDGERRWVADERKQKQMNPNKSFVRLTLTGNVVK